MTKTKEKKQENPLELERAALMKERAEIVQRLSQPKRDQVRLEEIDKRLDVLHQPNQGVEYVFQGKRDPDSSGPMPVFRTVVEINGEFHVVDPEWRFDGSGITPPFTEQEYERAYESNRLWGGGRDNVVDKATAQRLLDAGFEVRARPAQPGVTYGARQYAIANPNV